jgi:hypothetical protein
MQYLRQLWAALLGRSKPVSVLGFPSSVLVVAHDARLAHVIALDLDLLAECEKVLKNIERDHSKQNGDYKRHLALNSLCARRDLRKSNGTLNFHLELALQLQGRHAASSV